MNQLDDLLQRPLQAHITRDEKTKEIYTIHLNKIGNRYQGISIQLTEEQIKNLKWWY